MITPFSRPAACTKKLRARNMPVCHPRPTRLKRMTSPKCRLSLILREARQGEADSGVKPADEAGAVKGGRPLGAQNIGASQGAAHAPEKHPAPGMSRHALVRSGFRGTAEKESGKKGGAARHKGPPARHPGDVRGRRGKRVHAFPSPKRTGSQGFSRSPGTGFRKEDAFRMEREIPARCRNASSGTSARKRNGRNEREGKKRRTR